MLAGWSAYRSYKKLPETAKQLVIYSEGAQYWRFFAPIVKHLESVYEHKVCYVSSDNQDPGLQQENTIGLYIGEGFWRTVWFHNLQADVVLMTMPDLHHSHLKRSVYPTHYVYLFHSLMSTHSAYLEHAFDSYDSILCPTQAHQDEIRQTEKIYDLKEKHLIAAGYPLLDQLLSDYEHYQRHCQQPKGNQEKDSGALKVLYAPSWGEELSLVTCGEQIINQLLQEGHEVFFRPHPQSFQANPALMTKLLTHYTNTHSFHYQPQTAHNQALFDADILVTDWSGIGFEFAFVMKKPIIFIDTSMKIRNPNYTKINMEPAESLYRESMGKVLAPKDISQINTLIQAMMDDNCVPQDAKAISSVPFNLGSSVPVIVDELMQLIQQTTKQKRGNHD